MAETNTNTLEIPYVPGGQEIYDSIMSQIEPDLTTEGRKLLSEKYKNETPEQTKLRAKRYSAAHAEYLRQYDAAMTVAKSRTVHYRRTLMTETEKRVHERDEVPLLTRIIDAIQAFIQPA